jgi:hypothetical protein
VMMFVVVTVLVMMVVSVVVVVVVDVGVPGPFHRPLVALFAPAVPAHQHTSSDRITKSRPATISTSVDPHSTQ